MLAALEEQPAEPAEERPGESAREPRRGRLRRARAGARAAPRGRGLGARRARLPSAAGGRARNRQDPRLGGARHLRPRERRPRLLGPLPRGRGRAGLLALGPGDPRLRPRCRPGRARLAARCGGGRGRPARPGDRREARHRAGDGASDSEEARFRLFDSVTSLLLAAARDRPIVIVLDDLHWADEPSLLLLRFAARELASSGLLILGTYRDVELGRHHPLARMLGEMSGIEGSGRIPLRGLSVAAVERYIEMTAGAPAPPGLADAVQEQTDGNPFFVGEVVRLLASEGKLTSGGSAAELQIPQGVREVVGRRLDRLSEETNAALRVAAVIGRDFDRELVWRVAKLEPQQLMKAAEEAVAERLVTDLGDGHYSFAHALVRDTLYEELTPAEALGAARAGRPGDRGDLRRERRRAAGRAGASLPGGGPARGSGEGDRLRAARRRAGHGAARLRGCRRRLRARARGARADGRARRGAAVQPAALARRSGGEVGPRRGRAAGVRAGRRIGPRAWTTPTAWSGPRSGSR